MEFKGTKGEWQMMDGGFSKKDKIIDTIQIYAANDDLEMVCKVTKDRLLHNKNQDFKANAKLIAAAPELLKALLTCLSRIEGRSHEPFAILEAKEAINKALN